MFAEIIPFYVVMDKKIVKIMTLKFTEIGAGEEESNVLLMADRNNSSDSSAHSHSLEAIDEEN